VKLEELVVEDLARELHDGDAAAWGSPDNPHVWRDCNEEHRERYRDLARARLRTASLRG
jgi:hypothetical protein